VKEGGCVARGNDAAADEPVSEPTSVPVNDRYAEARALAAAGNKVHAIKVVRERSGMSLCAVDDAARRPRALNCHRLNPDEIRSGYSEVLSRWRDATKSAKS